MKLKGYSRPTRNKLGLCASIHLASTIDSFVDNKIDLPWRNFLSPEVRVKFQREVPLFLGRQLNILVTLIDRRKLPCQTRSSAIAEGPRDASCQLKSCQLPRNSAETTYTTSPDQIDGMKLEI